ncbi:MAG TPA: OB-fold domain-containing protein [Acidimicrobiales bacterium]|nr:OB-fold domain-containing protein [Acidimicrobiales bacterium]
MTLAPQPPGVPVPRPSLFSAPYWEGCRLGELRFSRCGSCGAAIADAPRCCHRCGSTDLSWEVSSGRGTVYSWTVVWRPQTPAFQVPYVPVIVQFEEGFFLLSSLIGCEVDDVAEGLAVAVEFHPCGDGESLPYVRPAG